MGAAQTDVAVLLAVSFALGLILSAVYDLTAFLPAIGGKVFSPALRERLDAHVLPLLGRTLARKKTRLGRFAVSVTLFFHDLIFLILSGAVIAVAVYRFGDGQWRLGILTAVFCGSQVYRLTLRRAVLPASELLSYAVRCAFAYTVYFAVTPVKWLYGKISAAISKARLARTIRVYRKEVDKNVRKALLSGFLDVNISRSEEVRYGRRNKKKKARDDMDGDSSLRRGSDNIMCEPYEIQSKEEGSGSACSGA